MDEPSIFSCSHIEPITCYHIFPFSFGYRQSSAQKVHPSHKSRHVSRRRPEETILEDQRNVRVLGISVLLLPYGAWSNKSTPRSNGPQPRPVLWNARTVVTPGRTPKKLHLYINQKNVLIHLNTLLSTMTDPIEIGKDHQ